MSSSIHEPSAQVALHPTLQEYVLEHAPSSVKLHLGCGGHRLEGFINVDLYPYDETVPDSSRSGCRADAFADMRQLGLANDSVAEIFTAHTLEHFTRWDALDMLRDWWRMLRPAGVLVLETPDFARCILWLFHPKSWRRKLAQDMFYGNQWDRLDYETHRYVWSAREVKRTLCEIGFREVKVSHQTTTHYPGRDMRVVAVK